MSPPIYIIMGVIAAVILCWVRSNVQILYGTIEVITGLVLIVFAAYTPAQGAFSADFSKDFDVFHYTLNVTAYLGAIFVMVRGCDNIKQGWQKRQSLRLQS